MGSCSVLAIEESAGEKLSLFEWKWKSNASPKKRVHFSYNERSGEENSKQVRFVFWFFSSLNTTIVNLVLNIKAMF